MGSICQTPFGGSQSVIEYLGRFTHRIAISNHRIKNIAGDKIIFSYKDYRQQGVTKEMTLDALEFIRRFAMHILPKGFMRIRNYGILSSTSKETCTLIIKGIPSTNPVIYSRSRLHSFAAIVDGLYLFYGR